MGEPHLAKVGDQPVPQLFPAGVPLFTGRPRHGVRFIDGYPRGEGVRPSPFLDPSAVTPLVRAGVGHDRGRAGSHLASESVGISLYKFETICVEHAELVEVTRGHAGHEKLPHATDAPGAHGMAPAVPVVEAANYAHGPGVWRPYGKKDAGDVTNGSHPGPHDPVKVEVAALAEEVQVHLPQLRKVAVGVACGPGNPFPGYGEPVGEGVGPLLRTEDEKPFVVDAGHGLR